ncbi:glycosyl transferase [Caballeronia calidae]|uniref:Glycosyl transferase n=1 Tax=Caballeronia calidae TaxID=1777139 RepID=A0A158CS66_9BURK|nr:glycosyltransferase [Caballeronia calidae]SAK84437.1 glycosyl transferase [Caballeronia calidae]
MQQCRVLVINDFVQKGGAEEVYRQSVESLRAMPGVDVRCFDNSCLDPHAPASPAWNSAAAKALEEAIKDFRPHRVMVHNYHSVLSASVLGTIARYKRKLGYSTYMTCHDYHVVYYNPLLQYYTKDGTHTVPLEALNTLRTLRLRSSKKGLIHDALRKCYWHAMRALIKPERVFDAVLCPSPFMQQALRRRGIVNTVMLPNPSAVDLPPTPLKVSTSPRLNLAFVGRVAPEKGLVQFIELAQAAGFAHIQRIEVYGDGPDRAVIEQRFASLVASGQLVFFGRLAQDDLFTQLRASADALVLPSLCAENAPLAIIEAASLGLPALVHDVGSLSTFGNEVGNKVMFRSDPSSLRAAMSQLVEHLSQTGREYDISEYSSRHYATRLASLMRIGDGSAMPA